MRTFIALLLFALFLGSVNTYGDQDALFDMLAIRDPSTLEVDIIQNWHLVDGPTPTRQKYVTINVGEFIPGKNYRVPLRLVVPADRKAKGLHLTGGNRPETINKDRQPRGVENDLIKGGIGMAYTVVQELGSWGQKELAVASQQSFIKTLNPHDSIQYWGWPASLMRCITAAYAESDHVEPGKVAMSGGSKNGATPSLAIIHDNRMTAVYASVSPIAESPLRLCDKPAWDKLVAHEKRPLKHRFLGGTYGPVYNQAALDAGHTWADLQRLAKRVAPQIFIANNLPELRQRKVDMLFIPGTHDFVAFDQPWVGQHHPSIPIYLRANSGHGIRPPHPQAEKGVANLDAFLINHFFDGVEPLPKPPTVTTKRVGNNLNVTVTATAGDQLESGRIWWMYDRPPDGSTGYLKKRFPDEQSMEMTAKGNNTWTANIPLKSGASQIDFFSNHRKNIRYKSKTYNTCISSPYQRLRL